LYTEISKPSIEPPNIGTLEKEPMIEYANFSNGSDDNDINVRKTPPKKMNSRSTVSVIVNSVSSCRHKSSDKSDEKSTHQPAIPHKSTPFTKEVTPAADLKDRSVSKSIEKVNGNNSGSKNNLLKSKGKEKGVSSKQHADYAGNNRMINCKDIEISEDDGIVNSGDMLNEDTQLEVAKASEVVWAEAEAWIEAEVR
jgi:hypothetical protein